MCMGMCMYVRVPRTSQLLGCNKCGSAGPVEVINRTDSGAVSESIPHWTGCFMHQSLACGSN